jgi:RimJ/RimL family protein N-acetyltransferase
MTTPTLDVPVLETPRLILRGHTLADFEAMVGIWTDPIVQKHFHGEPLSREEVWSKLLKQFGSWAALGYGMWAVEEKASREYVGACGVFEVKRDIGSEFEGMPEAGWALASRMHGRGYATEAMMAALDWIEAHLGDPRLFCIIAPGNTPSVRVAEKCGFKPHGETVYKDEPTLILVRDPARKARTIESP